MLLICAATPFEIKPFTDWISRENIEGVEILVTGVGIMAATYSLTDAVVRKKPGMVLQAGIAGCFDPSFELGSVVSVRSEIVGDLGVKEGGRFKSLFDLNLLKENEGPWKDGRLQNEKAVLDRAALPAVDGVTVNEISTDTARISACQQQGIAVESMEGAALHYVALMQGIPFLQIRSLSNFVGERDKSKWLMAASIARLNEELQRIALKFLNT